MMAQWKVFWTENILYLKLERAAIAAEATTIESTAPMKIQLVSIDDLEM